MNERKGSSNFAVEEIHSANSPLYMAMRDPVLDQFMDYLAETKQDQESDPNAHLEIKLSAQMIKDVRESFRQSILSGERVLHILAELLAGSLLQGEFELHSNVIGVLPDSDDRPFLIRERISQQTLFSVTDIDLGNLMLDNFRYQKNGEWVPLTVSANFVEYLPVDRTKNGVNRLTSRVKAEEELCNKLVDELFDLDQLVTRDKELRQYSKFIKDIFGLKIVCENEQKCVEIHEKIEHMRLSLSDLAALEARHGIGFDLHQHGGSNFLKFIETKDYLNCAPEKMKKTGWRAIKSVVTWEDSLIEIQVQPLVNYYLELDHMSGPSHRSFKTKRDELRDEVARQIPLYSFYRDLLKMLFMETNVCFQYENASVVIS